MNSKKLITGVLLLIIAVCLIAYSCKKFKNESYFIVEVENISVPKTAYVEDTVSVYLYGYLWNSCHVIYFADFFPQDDDTTTILIKAYGIQDPYGYYCEEKRTPFEYEHIITFAGPGEYSFVIMQSEKLVELGKIVIENKSDTTSTIVIENPFMANIDGIFATDTTFALEVPVHIWGRLGPTSCYIFDKAEYSLQSNNNVLLEVSGIQKSGDIVCKNGTSVFDHILTVVFPEPGEYTFVNMQSGKLVELGKIVIEANPDE